MLVDTATFQQHPLIVKSTLGINVRNGDYSMIESRKFWQEP